MRRLVLPLVVLTSSALAQEPTPPARIDFVKQVVPILVGRCIECHGPKEQKGDLRLDAKAHAFPADDQEAWSILAGKPDDSEFARRIGLPIDDEDVMPAKGEPLTKPQQELLRQWIAEGAEWPAAGDEAIAAALAAQELPKLVFTLPEVDAAAAAAIDAAVAALRERGAVVQPVAADTRALDVNLSLLRDRIGDAEIALLRPLAPVLVWLNVSRTAVTDAAAEHLAALPELRRLHAANTALGDAAFAKLAALPKLEFLNAYGSQLGDAGLAALRAGAPALRRLHCWQSKATAAGVSALREGRASLEVDNGDYVEARLAAAQKEIADREARNRPVNTTCPVADKPVDAAQWVEHDGKRVAFCCAKCKAAFQKEPAKFAAKLPK